MGKLQFTKIAEHKNCLKGIRLNQTISGLYFYGWHHHNYVFHLGLWQSNNTLKAPRLHCGPRLHCVQYWPKMAQILKHIVVHVMRLCKVRNLGQRICLRNYAISAQKRALSDEISTRWWTDRRGQEGISRGNYDQRCILTTAQFHRDV